MCVYQTNGGSLSCKTMTKPRQTSKRPRLKSNMRQQQLRVLGHIGCGALDDSITMPPRLDVLERSVASSVYGGAVLYVLYDP